MFTFEMEYENFSKCLNLYNRKPVFLWMLDFVAQKMLASHLMRNNGAHTKDLMGLFSQKNALL